MITLFLVCIVAVVALWAYEYRRLSTNPDLNCLNDLFCPVRHHLGLAKKTGGTYIFLDRAKRENDMLTPDGRLEHISYPVPDPKGTIRDLYV